MTETGPDIAALVDLVTGYANGFVQAMGECGLAADALETLLLDHNIEGCPGCGWFVEAHELLGEDQHPDGHCDNCRPD